jgi:hypothetical protein
MQSIGDPRAIGRGSCGIVLREGDADEGRHDASAIPSPWASTLRTKCTRRYQLSSDEARGSPESSILSASPPPCSTTRRLINSSLIGFSSVALDVATRSYRRSSMTTPKAARSLQRFAGGFATADLHHPAGQLVGCAIAILQIPPTE